MVTVDCAVLVDGRRDEPLEDARVVVGDDGRITRVGRREDVEAEGDVYEHGVVIPGLVDAHVHLAGVRTMDPLRWAGADVATTTARATADLRRLLAAGFTSVRDLGSGTGLGLKTAVDEGVIPGPRVYTSGQAFSQTGGHGDSHFLPYEWARDRSGLSELVDGADACRTAARRRIRDGVDCIKVMATGGVLSEKDSPEQSQYTPAELRAFTEEAHRVGISVAAHAQGAPGIKSALDNGVDTIEHGFYVDEEAVERLLATDATLVPTLAIVQRIVEDGADHGVPEWGVEKAREAQRAHVESVRRAYEAGVPIALGTDFIGPDLVPHGENALEAELLVSEVGTSEMEAIRAGTGVAARTLPGDDVGVVEAGRYGDLLALESNPLDDIAALRDVEAVYKGGELVG